MVLLSANKYRSVYAFLFLLLLSSCQVYAPTQRPKAPAHPVSFIGSADSTSVGDLTWKAFFSDADLERLIDTALANNLDVRIATQRIEMARATFDVNRAALLPAVNAAGSAGVERFGKYTMNGVGNYDTNLSDNIGTDRRIPNPTPDFFLGLRSSWEIDIWGKLKNRRKAAFVRFLASEQGRHLVKTSLVAEVARLYYGLIALDSELNIIRQNIALQERAVQLVDVQKAAGRVTELAVQQFLAQLLGTRSLEIQVQQQIVETENQLNRLLGRYPQPIPRSKTINDQELPATVAAGIPAQMLRRRPDIRQAELELEAAHIDVEVARLQFLPSLTLTPYVGLNSFRATTLFDPASLAAGVLGGLAAPVFNRRPLRANYNYSVAQSREALYRYQQRIQTGFSEVVTNLKGIDNYRQVADIQAKEVDALERAVSISNDLFRSGYASYLEVITAQRSVLNAELGFIRTRQAQYNSLIDLYRSLGGGWQ
ncbi:TolC family protein [Nibrella viscosa]|uniref:TolC family protein n=1 Tax=Nibrella viscosa TaxID=1084524 RepID=A0ABP8KVJ6_9BACT